MRATSRSVQNLVGSSAQNRQVPAIQDLELDELKLPFTVGSIADYGVN